MNQKKKRELTNSAYKKKKLKNYNGRTVQILHTKIGKQHKEVFKRGKSLKLKTQNTLPSDYCRIVYEFCRLNEKKRIQQKKLCMIKQSLQYKEITPHTRESQR